MHLWDDTLVRVEPAEFLVVVTDQPLDVSGIILGDLWAEQPIHYLHHPQKVFPPFIIFWDVVSNKEGQDPSKKPHGCSCNKNNRVVDVCVETVI